MIPEDEKDPEEVVDTVDPETPDTEEAEGDPSAALEAEVMKWRELAVRTAADLDNFRKRSAREREDAIRYANQSLLEDLLPVIDNFEMGMQAAAQDKSSMIYVGMDMVRRQLADFFSGQGVTEIQADGEVFDPNIHEAVSHEVSADVEEGRIMRVHRRGFMLRDRLLRPATVVVAKGAADEEGGTEA